MLQKKRKHLYIDRVKKVLIICLSIGFMLSVMGQTVIAAEKNSVTYAYANDENTQVKAVSYTPSDYAEIYEDHLTLGETFTSSGIVYPIVGIDAGVFANTKLCSVLIKERETSFFIGNKAFMNASILNPLTIDDAGSITVSCDVDTIGDYAFSNVTVSNSICFEGDVTTIGSYAFEEVTVPGSFNFKGNIDKIGDYAFKNAGVVIVHQFREASTGAFYGTDISELKAIDGMEILGDNAFENCTSLRTVKLADSVTAIGDDCFKGCTSLTSVTLPSNENLTIGENAFPDQEGLVIVIPSEVTNISTYNFNSYTNVVFQIDIDCSTTVIQYFEDNNLKYKEGADGEVIQGENGGGSSENTEDEEDSNNTENDVTTPDTGDNAAEEGIGDTSVVDNNKDEASDNIEDSSNAQGSKEETTALEVPQQGKTYTCNNMIYKVTGSSTVTFMKPANKKIKKIVIPDKVEILGQSFDVTKINKKACYGYGKLTTVKIGDNVTAIGDQAFANCSKLKMVTIGKGLKKIGEKVFYKDGKLKKLIIKSSKLTSVGKGTLKGVNGLNIQAPKKKVEKYKKLFKKAK